jgi:hypothetical protein
MGILDRFLPGDGGGPGYKRADIQVDGAVGSWTATRTGGGGLALAGGQVVLGDQWLVFSPWDLDRTRQWLVTWLGKAGIPQLGNVDKLIGQTKLLDPVVVAVADVASARLVRGPSLFKPPAVELAFRDGRTLELGILASVGTANPSPDNLAAAQDFLAEVQRSVLT